MTLIQGKSPADPLYLMAVDIAEQCGVRDFEKLQKIIKLLSDMGALDITAIRAHYPLP
jgi:hypothetical protein